MLLLVSLMSRYKLLTSTWQVFTTKNDVFQPDNAFMLQPAEYTTYMQIAVLYIRVLFFQRAAKPSLYLSTVPELRERSAGLQHYHAHVWKRPWKVAENEGSGAEIAPTPLQVSKLYIIEKLPVKEKYAFNWTKTKKYYTTLVIFVVFISE